MIRTLSLFLPVFLLTNSLTSAADHKGHFAVGIEGGLLGPLSAARQGSDLSSLVEVSIEKFTGTNTVFGVSLLVSESELFLRPGIIPAIERLVVGWPQPKTSRLTQVGVYLRAFNPTKSFVKLYGIIGPSIDRLKDRPGQTKAEYAWGIRGGFGLRLELFPLVSLSFGPRLNFQSPSTFYYTASGGLVLFF